MAVACLKAVYGLAMVSEKCDKGSGMLYDTIDSPFCMTRAWGGLGVNVCRSGLIDLVGFG